MTRKIGVSLPDDLYDWMQSQVEQGHADSVSGLIAEAVAAVRQRLELAALVADLTAEFGEPGPEAKARVDMAIANLQELRGSNDARPIGGGA
ncbi:hypothetical protein [Microbispora sp. ATCC PTA-5024]|uniref:hypothetical protein n=1 Tax=Microbispora sp. ATCC PTA-5024 TaxID=316330 RepID=UPI0003DBE5C3|nr:hypothetical protein [Microbispora sp. ATCC PTA-5024]ETK31805.1 hypothetical protein MPTA5024_33100 [Microbispora sp. ATCC PTA-5024]